MRVLFIVSILFLVSLPLNVRSADVSLQVEEIIVEGWTLSSITEGSYDDFVLLWADLGIEPSDYLRNDQKPDSVYLLIYNHESSDATIYVEVYEYSLDQYAEVEFSLQKSLRDRATIMKRFLYGERIYQDGQYLFFIYSNEVASQTMIPYGKHGQASINLVDSFFVDFFQTLSPMIHGGTNEPPVVDFTGKVIWGVQPGDVFTWDSSHSTFTGSIGTGMSSSSGSDTTRWEVIDITDNQYAVLIGERRENVKIFNDYFSSVILDATYSIYEWHTVADGPIILESGSLTQAVIFPLFVDGVTIDSLLQDEIEHLPEKTVSESGGVINVYGRTASGMGFTPLVTQWIDITVHKGTGVLVSYESYYNDNEYSITVSRLGELTETNFNLDSRDFDINIISVEASLPSETLERGEPLNVRAELLDLSGNPLDGATVTARIGDEETILSGIGGGVYQGTIKTHDLSVGEHLLELTAEKEDFETGTDSASLSVKTPTMILALNLDSQARKGGKLDIETEVRDISGNPLTGVEVIAVIGDTQLALSPTRDGYYTGKLETNELELGDYSVVVNAEKEGYEPASTQESFELIQGGIPGFPYDSIIAGMIASMLILWLARDRVTQNLVQGEA